MAEHQEYVLNVDDDMKVTVLREGERVTISLRSVSFSVNVAVESIDLPLDCPLESVSYESKVLLLRTATTTAKVPLVFPGKDDMLAYCVGKGTTEQKEIAATATTSKSSLCDLLEQLCESESKKMSEKHMNNLFAAIQTELSQSTSAGHNTFSTEVQLQFKVIERCNTPVPPSRKAVPNDLLLTMITCNFFSNAVHSELIDMLIKRSDLQLLEAVLVTVTNLSEQLLIRILQYCLPLSDGECLVTKVLAHEFSGTELQKQIKTLEAKNVLALANYVIRQTEQYCLIMPEDCRYYEKALSWLNAILNVHIAAFVREDSLRERLANLSKMLSEWNQSNKNLLEWGQAVLLLSRQAAQKSSSKSLADYSIEYLIF